MRIENDYDREVYNGEIDQVEEGHPMPTSYRPHRGKRAVSYQLGLDTLSIFSATSDRHQGADAYTQQPQCPLQRRPDRHSWLAANRPSGASIGSSSAWSRVSVQESS
jgi:hypothetical protein